MKYIFPLFVIALCLSLGAYTVKANPSHFIPDLSASATTSVSYIGVGNTTTHEFDTLISGNTASVDTAVLLIQSTASNTASVLDATIYFSVDGVDWFAESPSIDNTNMFAHASTTAPHRFTGNTTASTTRFTLEIDDVPTRYVKAVFSVPSGAASSSVWSEWVGKRERTE